MERCVTSLEPKDGPSQASMTAPGSGSAQANLPRAALIAPDGPPVRVIEELPAVSAFTTPFRNARRGFRPEPRWVGANSTKRPARDGRYGFNTPRSSRMARWPTALAHLQSQRHGHAVRGGVWEPKFTFTRLPLRSNRWHLHSRRRIRPGRDHCRYRPHRYGADRLVRMLEPAAQSAPQ